MKEIFKVFRKNLKDMDKTLFFIGFILFVFGLLNIVTASSREAVVRYETGLYFYFFQQLKMLIIGFIGFLVIINIPTKKYYKLINFGYMVCLCLTIYLSFVGEDTKGAQNWINIMGFTFQPSEVSKIVIIVFLALLFEKWSKRLRKRIDKRYVLIAIIIFIGMFIPVIVFLQKDLGTMFIMTITFGVMFLASPVLKSDKLKTFVLLFAVGIIGIMGLYIKRGYILSTAQMARINYINPCSNYTSGGYQVCNGFIAFNSGSLLGLGIGKSKQKYSYIPEPHTDSVFAIIGEEYGVLRASLIFVAYVVILGRILFISSSASTLRGKYISLGIATYVFMHIFVNLGGLLGLIPLTGVPLPFLSYGGTFAICLTWALGIVQRISIETKNQKLIY